MSFVRVMNPHTIETRFYERGAGVTLEFRHRIYWRSRGRHSSESSREPRYDRPRLVNRSNCDGMIRCT